MSITKDPDMKRFLRELNNSPAGTRWRIAWYEMQRCVKAIRELDRNTTAALKGAHLLALQRNYITASELASRHLDELSLVHQWPPASTAEVRYRYVPIAQSRRRYRKAP